MLKTRRCHQTISEYIPFYITSITTLYFWSFFVSGYFAWPATDLGTHQVFAYVLLIQLINRDIDVDDKN